MSRIANAPIELPKGVEFNYDAGQASAKGSKGELKMNIHPDVALQTDDGSVRVVASCAHAAAVAGTMWSLVANMIHGVSQGFERKLQLVGVSYRAQAQGNKLNLQLGFSHPVEFEVPEGVSIETPSQNEVVVRGSDKQLVGQVAAKIRAYRPPEPYKGKGVRYEDERSEEH